MFALSKDKEEGKEWAEVWYTMLKDYPKAEVYDAFIRARSAYSDFMPPIPVILEYIRIKREQTELEKERILRAEEAKREEEEYNKPENIENRKRISEMIKSMFRANK